MRWGSKPPAPRAVTGGRRRRRSPGVRQQLARGAMCLLYPRPPPAAAALAAYPDDPLPGAGRTRLRVARMMAILTYLLVTRQQADAAP